MESLSSLKHEAGSIPPPTCSLIDSCVREVKRTSEELAYIKKTSNYYETSEDVFDDLPEIDEGFLIDKLEEIRTANEQLRHLGEFWYEKYSKLLEEINENE